MAGPLAAAGISAATGLIGGALSSRSARRNAARDREMQREFAQNGIRWRVEDAKAAGLHPLFALGAQVPAYTPVSVGDTSMGASISEMGQNISRAVAAQSTPYEREAQKLQLALLRSQIGESDARRDLYRSEAFGNMNQVVTFPVPDASEGVISEWQPDAIAGFGQQIHDAGESPPQGQFISQAPTVIQTGPNPGKTAGPGTPMWNKFNVDDGVSVYLPGGIQGDAAEVLETLGESPAIMAAVIAYNAKESPAAAAWLREIFGMKASKSSWVDRLPTTRLGHWIGGKLADLRDRASRGSYKKPR